MLRPGDARVKLDLRTTLVNERPVQPGDHVVYWMIASRRPGWNFALERAAAWARELGLPLVVLEALRAGYPWACDRLHAFVLQGMADNARAFAARNIRYHPYIEPRPGAGKGLLGALAERAALVVTDDWPCFFLPHMVAAAGRALPCRLEQVDSNGLLPIRAAARVFTTAASFRLFLQRELPAHLAMPAADPLHRLPGPARLPRNLLRRWPAASPELLAADPRALARLPIDHTVGPAPTRGGTRTARATLARFLDEKLGRYLTERAEPEADVTSRLSPYLHFGQISVHEVFSASDNLARKVPIRGYVARYAPDQAPIDKRRGPARFRT
jgi:deoxyribodipyrimidine photo-lyase